MNDLQALQHQLEEARDEAELNLLQLQQVQEELEFYFLRCQELEQQLGGIKQAEVLDKEIAGKSDEVSQAL
jgi:chaperonin cofactor prefoldin